MATPPLNPLVTKIRAAYPGAYDDMDDATLTKKILAKYPQYSDLAVPKPQMPAGVIPQYGPEGLEKSPGNPNQVTGGLPGMAGNRPTTGADLIPGAVVGGAAGLAATPTVVGAAASAAIPPVLAVGKWAGANPIKAWLALQAAKELVPGVKKITDLVKKAPGK